MGGKISRLTKNSLPDYLRKAQMQNLDGKQINNIDKYSVCQ